MKKIIEKFKSFYDDTYGKLITISWVLLILCLIIKLFGGNWFELNTENSKFIEFCLYVEEHNILKMSIACIIYLISGYFILSCILNKKLNIKLLMLFYPIMILKSILNWNYYILSFIIDLIILIAIPLIITKNWKRVLISFLILNALQIISILVRNVSFYFNELNTTVENMLYQIDYYIMIILWYSYTFKRKESK